MKPSDTSGLYISRLLVFVEESPQSNLYRQVMLNPVQFKKVSDAVVTVEKPQDKDGIEQVSFNQSEELYTLPELQDIQYDPS